MAEAEKELVISPRRKILRFCLVSLIVVVCAYVMLYASVLMLAARKEAEVKQRLKDLVPNVEQLANQRASVEENETARLMREWGEKERSFETYEDAIFIPSEDAHLAVDYFFQETLPEQAKILFPFESFVDKQQSFLESLRLQVDQLPPRCQIQVDEHGVILEFNRFYASGLGLLVLDILVKMKRNEMEAAFRSFQTAWTIIEAYRTFIPISARSIAFHYQVLLIQVLRKLNSVSPDWQPRISTFDYRTAWKKTLVVNYWRFLQTTKKNTDCYLLFEPSMLLGNRGRLFADLIWPYFWLCAVNTTEVRLTQMEQRWTQGLYPCWGIKDQEIIIINKLPGWNRWHEQTWPLPNPFSRIARLEFETERTQLILHLKELQQKSPAGKLPVTLPKMESKVCPGEYWEYQLQPDGTPILKFSQPIENSEFKL